MRDKILIFILIFLAGYLALQLWFKNPGAAGQPATLPGNIKQEVIIKDDKATITRRVPAAVPGGAEKIVREIKYVPPEGGAAISVNIDGNSNVKINNKGLTFTPGAFFLAGRDTSAGLGARLLYWDKCGLGAGAAISLAENHAAEPFVFADMRLEHIGLNNAAAGIFAKPAAVGLSIAVYFK